MNEIIKKLPTGPEDIPLQGGYVKSFELMVIISNLDKDCIEREVKIDYGNAEDRRWLGRVSFWAATNGRSVETMSLKDYEKYK